MGWLSVKDLMGVGNYKIHMTSLVLSHGGQSKGTAKQTNKHGLKKIKITT